MGCAPSQRHDHLKNLTGISTGRRKTEFVSLSSEEIDEQIIEDGILQRGTVKLMLLGSGNELKVEDNIEPTPFSNESIHFVLNYSGKSTLVKQMKILHTGGFTDSELTNYRYLIFRNIVEAIESLVKGAAFLNLTLDNQSQKNVSLFFDFAAHYDENSGQILDLANQIWKSREVQECFAQKHRLASLTENVEYFLSNLSRIAADNYEPNNLDILYCRSHTSGVYCTEFTQSEKQIRLIDVGGQKSERRKWIHCFDDVTAILFVTALSGYDQMLEEKPTENRMFDSLALFDEICKSDYFRETAIVLFLNKKDVFEEKIKKVPLSVCFTDYTGENDDNNASEYIHNQFLLENLEPEREIYSHFTKATDTQNIDNVFKDVIDTVIGKNMGTSGFE